MATVTQIPRRIELSDEELDYKIDELYPEVKIAGNVFYASDILKELAPLDYEMTRSNFEEEETIYVCDECGEEFDDEFEAECCCDIDEDEEEDD